MCIRHRINRIGSDIIENIYKNHLISKCSVKWKLSAHKNTEN